MTRELKQLTEYELEELYFKVRNMREEVITLLGDFNYDASSLVSRTFEHDIEMEFGRKTLKSKNKIKVDKPNE
ncbi:MAG: hypothetical protein ACRD9Q_08080 [Nitrososphaeraceae archaeon]